MASVDVDLGPRDVEASLIATSADGTQGAGDESAYLEGALDGARARSAKTSRPSPSPGVCDALFGSCIGFLKSASLRTRIILVALVIAAVVNVVVAVVLVRRRGAASDPAPSSALPSVALGNAAAPGMRLPFLGLGTGAYGPSISVGYGRYPECGSETAGCGNFTRRAVREWIAAGGTRIDASDDYDNQRSVGLGIADSGVPRASLFVLSKVGPGMSLGYADALAQCAGILADMGLEYVDALLVHWPDASLHGATNATRSSEAACRPDDPAANATRCRLDTWRALLELQASGRARAVGVSNYNETHLAEIEAAGLPLPALNQVVYHPYRSSSQARLLAYMRPRGIVLDAYSPLGVPDVHAFPPGADLAAGPLAPSTLLDPVVLRVAATHGSTPAAVVFAWLWALGLPSVPRSQNATHMAENLAVFGFGGAPPLRLSPAEVLELSSRPQNLCADDPMWYECAPPQAASA